MQSDQETGESGAVASLQRREFLLLGSAAMVGVAATSLHGEVIGRIVSTPMPLLSVGFWNGTIEEIKSESGAPSPRAVVAADRLVAADASLARHGARVTVHGFWRAPVHRTPVSLGLLASYPQADPANPFIAWMWRPNARASNVARFDVPVTDTLALSVERFHSQASPAPRRLRELFSAATTNVPRTGLAAMSPFTGSRGIKLRRGVYFFAVRENDADALPSWSSMRVAPSPAAFDAGGAGVLRVGSTLGLERAPFSYLVISVDAVPV